MPSIPGVPDYWNLSLHPERAEELEAAIEACPDRGPAVPGTGLNLCRAGRGPKIPGLACRVACRICRTAAIDAMRALADLDAGSLQSSRPISGNPSTSGGAIMATGGSATTTQQTLQDVLGTLTKDAATLTADQATVAKDQAAVAGDSAAAASAMKGAGIPKAAVMAGDGQSVSVVTLGSDGTLTTESIPIASSIVIQPPPISDPVPPGQPSTDPNAGAAPASGSSS